ncbi:hypothetical protein DFQ27_006560 [Actinomortierella ambigua]|uniref:Transmembrane protein n=1 Tax=Actinomortierella ambigua TaxID=1343610 RepID=A0A9P6QKQ2_9FUNG|nr:hypothetical protein DFQ27_006560 [Actinomortierella ambigua]
MALSKVFVWTLFALVAFMAVCVSAQSPTPTSTEVSPSSVPTSSNSGPTPTIPSIPTRPSTNYTGPAPGQFDTLRSIIDSYATGRANNPGSSPTPKPDGTGSGADKAVVMGSLAILATVAMTAAGFIL